MSVFATRLKIALENKNMKPSTLAYRIGVDRSTISNYLNGRYKAKILRRLTEEFLKVCLF